MNTATIRLLMRCNLRCDFCHARSEHDDPARFAADVVRAAMDRALHAGAKELVLTGGEPTLRTDLPSLVGYAARPGIRVVLETNAMALSLPGRAQALADAAQGAGGSLVIRWGIAALDAKMDAIGHRKGAFTLGLRGVQEAVKSGLQVELSYALTAAGLEGCDHLPTWMQKHLPNGTPLHVRVVKEGPASSVARPKQAAAALRSLARACRAAEIPLHLDPRYALPLCALTGANQLPELFRVATSGTGDNLRRITACESCGIRDLCAGVDAAWVAQVGEDDFSPVHERHRRRAKGLKSGRSAREAQLAPSEGLWSEHAGAAQLERVVRVNYHCNQDCAFCFVDRVLPPPAGELVEAQIARAAADGVALLSLSGGEPTLDPKLVDYIRYGTSLGLRVQIQTNATRLGDPKLTAALAKAGLAEAFISLHGADAKTSDAVTRAPGTFAQTLLGIDQLVAHGVRVSLNCVITGPNHQALEAIVRLIASRWQGRPTLNFSWANANSALVPIEEQVTPSFDSVRPYLAAAMRSCRDLDLDWRGLTGECGVPLCFPDAAWLDPSRIPDLHVREPGPGFLKPAACDDCALSERCVGVRQGYADLHGFSELRPVHDIEAWKAGSTRRQRE